MLKVLLSNITFIDPYMSVRIYFLFACSIIEITSAEGCPNLLFFPTLITDNAGFASEKKIMA